MHLIGLVASNILNLLTRKFKIPRTTRSHFFLHTRINLLIGVWYCTTISHHHHGSWLLIALINPRLINHPIPDTHVSPTRSYTQPTQTTDSMFKLQLSIFLIVALIGQFAQETQALAFSRRGFFGNVATAGVVAVTAAACPGIASAAPEKPKSTRRPAFRGGNKVITDTHNGTVLNDKQADVAGGLLGKMGISDISPDKDAIKGRR